MITLREIIRQWRVIEDDLVQSGHARYHKNVMMPHELAHIVEQREYVDDIHEEIDNEKA
jgi:hypothetical protein